MSYKDAGVDIDAGAELVRRIRGDVEATRRPEVLSGIGGFAGLCRLPERYRDPVLVSGTDGVGTKLKTAFATGRHDTVGVDLVAMAVNDILVVGAEPLFFLDYYATGALEVDVAEAVVRGIAAGCREAGCALLGGETAELPGFYGGGEYDLAGFCVGVVERDEIRDGTDLAEGDVLVGLPSSGLHSNGHSLARKALMSTLGLSLDSRPEALGGTVLADVLLEPTRIYARAFADLAEAGVRFRAASHITGGGLVENPPRMLPGDALACRLDTSTWEVPAIFPLIASAGVDEAEMRRTFNLGLGMVIAVSEADADAAVAALAAHDPRAVGAVVARDGGDPVRFDG